MRASKNRLFLLGAGVLIGAGVGLVLIFLFGFGAAYFTGLGKSILKEPALVPEQDSPAPDFSAQNLAGQTVRLSDFRGHPVLVNFWATWCEPCRYEMPLLQKYHQQYGQDLVVLGVNVGEASSDIQPFVKDMGLTFDVLLDPDQKVEDLYRVRAYPTSVFIDAQGVIRSIHLGSLNENQLTGYLERIGVNQ